MIIFSFDDYHEDNIDLVKICLAQDIKPIFFIECDNNEKLQQIQKLSEMGCEIGCHTVNHPMDMKLLNADQLEFEILSAKRIIEQRIKKEIKWFCFPRGRYDKRIMQKVEDFGFFKTRSTKIRENRSDNLQNKTVDLFHLYPRKEYKGKDVFKLIYDRMEKGNGNQHSLNIHIWGHRKEIREYFYFNRLKRLLKHIHDKNLHSKYI